MSAMQKEVCNYIGVLSDDTLVSLLPLVKMLADSESDDFLIETDLTDAEHELIEAGVREYRANPEIFISLKEILSDKKERV